jgi:hypothetical protein
VRDLGPAATNSPPPAQLGRRASRRRAPVVIADSDNDERETSEQSPPALLKLQTSPTVALVSGVTDRAASATAKPDTSMPGNTLCNMLGMPGRSPAQGRRIDFDADGSPPTPTPADDAAPATLPTSDRFDDVEKDKDDADHAYSPTNTNHEHDVAENGDNDEIHDVPMTQEEEEVTVALKGLDCSQDAVLADEPTPFAFASPSSKATSGANFNAGTNFNGSDDNGMLEVQHPSPTRASLSPHSCGSPSSDGSTPSNPCPNKVAAGCGSDLDNSDRDDELLMAPIAGPRRSLRSSVENISRCKPDAFSTVSRARVFDANDSVFGYSGIKPSMRLRARPRTSGVVREHAKHEARERELEELRRDVEGHSSTQVNDADSPFAQMAAAQERDRMAKKKVYDKYNCPVPLFTGVVSMVTADPRHWEAHKKPIHPLHSLLLGAQNCNKNGDIGDIISLPLIQWTLNPDRTSIHPDLDSIAIIDMLFQQTVYDDSDETAGVRGRQDMFWMLHGLISKSQTAARNLPPLRTVLASYGAEFDKDASADCSQNGVSASTSPDSKISPPCSQRDDTAAVDGALIRERTAGMRSDSLDYDAFVFDDKDIQPITSRAVRNLGRAFRLFACAVSSGTGLSSLASVSAAGGDSMNVDSYRAINASDAEWSTERDADASVSIVTACVRVMISPFGSQLCREAGLLITAVLERISSPAGWPSFRWRVAKSIAALTNRLGIQVELVTYLLPYLTTRSRNMLLDVTYLFFYQWSRGSGPDPQPRAVTNLQPSQSAIDAGLDLISFTLSDVAQRMSQVTEMDKDTDDTWACGLMRLLKQVVANDDVIARRGAGDLESLSATVKKTRRLAHRLGDGIPVQDLRLALDGLRHVLKSCGSASNEAFFEANPLQRGKKIQTTMLSMFGSGGTHVKN